MPFARYRWGVGRLLLAPNRVEFTPRANVRQGDPSAFRLLRIGGKQLEEILSRARPKHYYEVPLPVAVYDRLASQHDTD
jgi:hypothetical protein